MPPSMCPTTPGPKASKRTMSDPESAPQDSKKPRRNSAEPSTSRESNRDAKRRRRKKKKSPIVGAAAAKVDAPQIRMGERSRAPLSVRNQVIRFTSPPEAHLPARVTPDATDLHASSSKHLGKRRASSLPTDDTSEHQFSAPSVLKDKTWPAQTNVPVFGPSSCSLEEKVAKLEAELKSKDNLVASHHTLLNQIQQTVTCQICLDLMYRPYALAPCGHLVCYDCLVSWFTAPPPDNRPAPPAIMRRKSCPHCRAVVLEPPVQVWGVKNIVQAVTKSGLLLNQLPVPAAELDGPNANADPWKNIFPKPGATGHRGFPWSFPDVDIDDDLDIADDAPRGEDVGMLDIEDGGIYRCLDCMHEIWDGVCSSCGRIYPGHRPGLDNEEYEEYEENPMGWLEDQMGAEEVDVADDPGWMGLEDGEADDDGNDVDERRPLDPWRRHFRLFRGPWGFLGTIHVDEEDEDGDDMNGRVDDLRAPDEDEESGDEGYESSFIDDDDEGGGTTGFFDGPRFYEIGDDDEDEDHRPHELRHVVAPGSDEGEHEREGFDAPERGWTGRRRAPIVVSSDEEANSDEREDGFGPSRLRPQSQRGCELVGSDGFDVYWSDG